MKVGPYDGYLYALSIGDGALYRILPNAAGITSFADDFKQGNEEEQNDNQPFGMPTNQLDIAAPDKNVNVKIGRMIA